MPPIHASKEKLLRLIVSHLPNQLRVSLLKRRPHLVNLLPDDFRFEWPYFSRDIKVSVNTSNRIEIQSVKGIYDPDSSRMMRFFIKPGCYCIDIGANVGILTMYMAKLAGENGRILSLEPGPPYFKALNHNLELNPRLKQHITVLNMGVSDNPATLIWAPDPNASYNAGMLDERGMLRKHDTDGISNATSAPVMVDTLDSILTQNAMEKVDFIKIDVEGMEFEVLKGSKQVLKKYRPVVLLETGSGFTSQRGFNIFAEIEELLKTVGYGMYYLSIGNELLRLTHESLPENTLAIPDGKVQRNESSKIVYNPH